MTTLAFWKPYGVLTQFTDRQGRPTLADLIEVPDVYPIGRLDLDSEGLLLLSDDGDLAARLTHPRYGHPRAYLVQVERVPSAAAIRQLARGVTLKDGPTLPATAELLDHEPVLPPRDPPIRDRPSVPTAWIRLTLTEGRNRQVRRMTAAVGHPTLRLVRERVGTITLDGLTPGVWRRLGSTEMASLRRRA